MFEYVNAMGYDIVDLGDDQWLLDVKGVSKYHGTFAELVRFCVKKYGFEINELEMAVGVMVRSDHNALSFGAYKTFIYSFNQEVPRVKKAG